MFFRCLGCGRAALFVKKLSGIISVWRLYCEISGGIDDTHVVSYAVVDKALYIMYCKV